MLKRAPLFIFIFLLPLFSVAQPYPEQNGNTLLIANTTVKKSRVEKRHEQDELLERIKQLYTPEGEYNASSKKGLYKLAGFFTRLRLYPLAMKCFSKTFERDSLTDDELPFGNNDEKAVLNKVMLTGNPKTLLKTKPFRTDSLLEVFADGKQAKAYAMLIHVKQPVRGKPKIYKFTYTGHTYITLIKFNIDSSYSSASFGFGPKKDKILSATPLRQKSLAGLRDDSSYPWDELVGKFISKRKFDKILELAGQYNGSAYHLSRNNCTDFGIKAANLAGITIDETWGKWPFGKGNNPAITGQSILSGKLSNADTGNLSDLFIDVVN